MALGIPTQAVLNYQGCKRLHLRQAGAPAAGRSRAEMGPRGGDERGSVPGAAEEAAGQGPQAGLTPFRWVLRCCGPPYLCAMASSSRDSTLNETRASTPGALRAPYPDELSCGLWNRSLSAPTLGESQL